MKTQANPSRNDENGFTLVEVMVASMLVAIFFASLFELNAMCLRSIDSGKESLAALQSVQDRNEVLRNLAFSDLTTTAFVQNLMPCQLHASRSGWLKPKFSKKATEVVKISKYNPLRSHRPTDLPNSRARPTAASRRIL